MARKKSLVRYGFVGAGAITQRRHLPEAELDPRVRVVAVADPVRTNALEALEGRRLKYYSDYRRMFDAGGLDVVVVAGPNALHAEMALAAFEAGLHVLCEKPMATSMADAVAMVDAADRAGRHLMVAMNQRFMPQHIKARKILASGRLGGVLSFRSVFAHAGPEAWSVEGEATWFLKGGTAGMGALGDLGVHKIDLLRWILDDEFFRTSAEITTLDKRDANGRLIKPDDNASVTLRTRGGAVGNISASWTHYGEQDHHTLIACEEGVIRIGLDAADHLVIHHRGGDHEAYRFAGVNASGWPNTSGVIRAMTDLVLGRSALVATGKDALRTMRTLFAAIESGTKRRTIKIA